MSVQLSLLEPETNQQPAKPVVNYQLPVASFRQQAPIDWQPPVYRGKLATGNHQRTGAGWHLVPAARLERPVAPVVASGTAEVDAITGGLPRGALTEICGPASSGRTSLLLAALAEATRRQETCALVDAADSFDPHSAVAAGVDLERLLWIRCGEPVASHRSWGPQRRPSLPALECSLIASEWCKRSVTGDWRLATDNWFWCLEQALKVTDLLLQGGGFGLVAVDLADVPAEHARRVPLASWFRFRRAVEYTHTVLLVVEQEPHAKSCASLVLRTSRQSLETSGQLPAHAQLFQGIRARVEVVRAGVDVTRKPARSTAFSTQLSFPALSG